MRVRSGFRRIEAIVAKGRGRSIVRQTAPAQSAPSSMGRRPACRAIGCSARQAAKALAALQGGHNVPIDEPEIIVAAIREVVKSLKH
jgi:hypothetical protein